MKTTLHLHLLKIKAAAGSGEAMAQLGTIYYQGRGVPADPVLAERYFRASADRGNPIGMYLLGSFFEHAKQERATALLWYERAAEAGVPDAQRCTADLYVCGIAIPQDLEKASYWYHKAAENDIPEAQFVLGEFYRTGKSTPVNHLKAYEWYQRSEANGYEPAGLRIRQHYPAGPKPTTASNARSGVRTDIPGPDEALPMDPGAFPAMLQEAEIRGCLEGGSLAAIPELHGMYQSAAINLFKLITDIEPEARQSAAFQFSRYLFAKGVEGVILWGATSDGNISVYFDPRHVTRKFETEVPKQFHQIVEDSMEVADFLFGAHQRWILAEQKANRDPDISREIGGLLRWMPLFGISWAMNNHLQYLTRSTTHHS
jgi:TPR repeat protein